MESNSSDEEEQDESGTGKSTNVDYRAQYRYLKHKLKYLIYENEFFQDALRSNQRRLLKVTKDRTFLLDRLLQYQKKENSTSESETESSDDDTLKEAKKRKLEHTSSAANSSSGAGGGGFSARGRKKKIMPTSDIVVVTEPTIPLPPVVVEQQSTAPKHTLQTNIQQEAANSLLEQYGNCVQ